MIILYIKNLETFSKIEASIKTVEVRLNRGFIKNLDLKINDKISFEYQQKQCLVKITNIKYYNSIEECLKNNKLDTIYGEKTTYKHIYNHYNDIYKNSINKHSCIVFHFTRV
jgi:ASC-1-like (ASCH) protein